MTTTEQIRAEVERRTEEKTTQDKEIETLIFCDIIEMTAKKAIDNPTDKEKEIALMTKKIEYLRNMIKTSINILQESENTPSWKKTYVYEGPIKEEDIEKMLLDLSVDKGEKRTNIALPDRVVNALQEQDVDLEKEIKAPDKIYLGIGSLMDGRGKVIKFIYSDWVKEPSPSAERNVEYICKDALLEWLNKTAAEYKKRSDEGELVWQHMCGIKEVIDILNEM